MQLGNIAPCGPLSTMITQKLKYTCRWLRSQNDLAAESLFRVQRLVLNLSSETFEVLQVFFFQ